MGLSVFEQRVAEADQATDPAIRLAAGMGSVGDAWNAYRASVR
jgi:uncharacterized protein (DUF736 family)